MFRFLGIPWGADQSVDTMKVMKDHHHQTQPGLVWHFENAGSDGCCCCYDGGNVRVGLEDNLYLSKGVLATNSQLVEKIIKIINLMGGRVLTPDETRKNFH